MIKGAEWILVASIVVLAGCSVPIRETVYFPGYEHRVTVEGHEQQFGSLELAQSDDDTVFRAVVLDFVMPTILAHPGKCLQFVIADEDLVAGNRLTMSDVDAFCIGMDGYTVGAGFVEEGTVSVDAVEGDRVTLTLDSPELDERFQGAHVFRQTSPSLAKGGNEMLTGQIRNPVRPQRQAGR